MHILKKLDDYLNACVDYYDYRIRTGKFIGDIKYYLGLVVVFIKQTWRKEYSTVAKSNGLFIVFAILKTIWQILMKIPFLNITALFLIQTIRIIISCYAEIFIVFAFTFPLTILLLNFFQTAVIAFFVGLIPILLLNIYCVSALYNFIAHKEAGERITLWQSFHMLTPRFSSIIFPALAESAIIQESFFGLIIVALFLSYTFELVHVSWDGSFIYWFIVLSVVFFLIIGFFILSIIMYQTYFAILLEKLSFQEAYKRSRTIITTNFSYFCIFYLVLYCIFALILLKAAVAYLYLGVTIGLYCFCIVIAFMAFLLWKKFSIPTVKQEETPTRKPPFIIIVIIAFGFVNYVLLSVFLIKEYQPLKTFIQQQEDNFLASQEMRVYTNNAYGYTIQYPQAWTVYKWTDGSTTFYNNYTNTISGGTWMTINVSSYNQQAFEQLFSADPGIIIETGTTKEITTKITNMSIQGYDTVNYTFVKQTNPYAQFETHYLIHKGNLLYDIAFISESNDVANYDSNLFQRIISSFQFTK